MTATATRTTNTPDPAGRLNLTTPSVRLTRAVVEWETYRGNRGQMVFTADDVNNSKPGVWGMMRDAIQYRNDLRDTCELYTLTLRFS